MEDMRPNKGEYPPTWNYVVGELHPLFGLFALIEYPANWWVWLWRRNAGVRTLVEFAGATIIVAGVYGLYLEREDRKVDRGVRIATLFAQIAQVHALPNGGGLKALKPSVEALARERVSMSGLDLSDADLIIANLSGAKLYAANLSGARLSGADLSGVSLSGANLYAANLYAASLSGANLSGARLHTANLSGASLSGADLSGASLYTANLTGANLIGANLTGADLTSANLTDAELREARNLTQAQLDAACVSEGGEKPELSKGLSAPTSICPPR